MPRKKKNRYHLKKTSLFSAISFFKEKYSHFTLTKTGHTFKVEAGNEVYFFSDNNAGKQTFITTKLIENDVTPQLDLITEINPDKIKYYEFTENNIEEISCVDISAAYPNALRNLGYISDKTFNNIMKLKKPDRLKTVGMLATKKAIYEVEEKKLKSATTIRKKTEKVFFSICNEIGELMNSILLKYGSDIVFFWVDGIFCKKEIALEILKEMENKGYPAKIEEVKNLKKSKKGNFLFYQKMGKKGWENKILPIPRKKTIFDENILKFLSGEIEVKEIIV